MDLFGLVDGRGAAAQLCVVQGGRVVIDHAVGCESDSLFWVFSTSKPFIALAVHRLAERGELDLDDPVARHWPEFGQSGKAGVTVRQVLQHRSGFATATGGALADSLTMADWERSCRRIERTRPRWPPGVAPAYQFLTYGFTLGELLRRVTGREVREFVTTELLAPASLRDSFLGLPERQWHRHVPVRVQRRGGSLVQAVVNSRRIRGAVIPSAGLSTTARDLARFYAMLLRGGEIDGTRVLRPETIAVARTASNDAGDVDRHLGTPIRWAQGFQLGGPRPGSSRVPPTGRLAGPLTFGHNGSNCCIAWADPDRDLAVAYLTNALRSPAADVAHQAAVADAIIANGPWPALR
jgi:CubicO group peptidase (beta-lactamase class C family)